MNSIVKGNEKGKCFICSRKCNTEIHHIFYGTCNRRISEKYGLKVDLCHFCHNEPPYGVHFNKNLDKKLKSDIQLEAMLYYGWSTAEFVNKFGKNYIY